LKGFQLAPLINGRFLVDQGVEKAVLIAGRGAFGQPVRLLDPLGRQLTPNTKVRQARWLASPAYDMVTLLRPRPGTWRVQGVQKGEGTVVLSTPLALTCPHLPGKIRTDEELLIRAVVTDRRTNSPVALRQNTVFRAVLRPEQGDPVTVELRPLPGAPPEGGPKGLRMGTFPPLGSPGRAKLTVTVLTPSFQRERRFDLRVAGAWYQVDGSHRARAKARVIKFRPLVSGLPKNLCGLLRLKPETGGVAARLFRPEPGGAFSMTLLPRGLRPSAISLSLAGSLPSGRPVVIRPAIPGLRLPTSGGQDAPETGLLTRLKTRLKKLEARCQLLARTTRGRLILAALALLLGSLAAGLWLTRDCWQEFSLKDLTQGLPVLGGSQDKLLLLAQIETLHKEKAELLEKLDQLQGQLRQMAEENAGLRMEVEKKSQELRQRAQKISELEETLAEAKEGGTASAPGGIRRRRSALRLQSPTRGSPQRSCRPRFVHKKW
ncbi:MAG: hypothetical protein JRI59_11685, partial [Deltaproteobacteria bacterium]|nr:hypothetical protein [Deltaproteobacteria bacterium]